MAITPPVIVEKEQQMGIFRCLDGGFGGGGRGVPTPPLQSVEFDAMGAVGETTAVSTHCKHGRTIAADE